MGILTALEELKPLVVTYEGSFLSAMEQGALGAEDIVAYLAGLPRSEEKRNLGALISGPTL